MSLGHGRLDRRRDSLVTHPLGAAPPGQLHSPGAWAVPAGQAHILTAQRQAGEATVVTAAEDPAIGLKRLPIQVPVAIHLTAPVILFQEAHCPPATGTCPGLTNQALAEVTDMQVVAGLPEPPGTHLTAATAIQHQVCPQWALGRRPGTGTGCWAQLGTHH